MPWSSRDRFVTTLTVMAIELGGFPHSWEGFHRFVQEWVGPHDESYMIPYAELDAQVLPDPLRHYLHWYGRWPDPQYGLKVRGRSGFGSFLRIWVPDGCDAINDELVRFGEDDSQINQLATHRTGEDPPVLYCDGKYNGDPSSWRVEHPSLRGFIIQMMIRSMSWLGVSQVAQDRQLEVALGMLESGELLFEIEAGPHDAAESVTYIDDVMIFDVGSHPTRPRRKASVLLVAKDNETFQRHFGEPLT